MADGRWHQGLMAHAISPQPAAMSPYAYREQALAVLDGLSVLHVDVHDLAVVLGVDLVHQLHRLDDAQHLTFLHGRADVDEWRRARFRGSIERADDRRFHDRELDFRVR